jgi:phage/plasmid primase-like uncharacterized protein
LATLGDIYLSIANSQREEFPDTEWNSLVVESMLAAISDAKGRMLALHRTYLAPDGSAKAPVQPPKMTLGQVAGLACHLGNPKNEIAVAEGIETALSVQLATGIPTWAALSAGGLRRLILPPAPNAGFVTIAADADVVGIEAARVAALRWKEEGRRIRVIVPSRPGTDFNDLMPAASRPAYRA